MPVPFRMVGVHARDIDRDLEGGLRRIILVVAEFPVKFVEPAQHIGIPQVTCLEFDEGVVEVDHIVLGDGLVRRKRHASQGD